MPETGEAPPQGTLLGFDFGFRRIGVAVGQTMTRTASPLAVVRHTDAPDWAAIDKLLKEWRPAGLVVGLPLGIEGDDTDMSKAARAFGAALGERAGKPVFYCDERLTSQAAEAGFAARRADGRARRRDAAMLDAVAAGIILENWLTSPAATRAGNVSETD
ncbi:Holliday junction resolvase RuvX [Marinihelvus fidelis]|uniref:Putative pre-16S rRNA nuclease n=1 Tax=Marinihelvus fidelis TaxID=2613842 RepID=A0A5N0TA08_9GAMM|nr:Holliday junction resolvase RuvX [Marinihelvus fidelis]KAA9130957.1 Holliday junction resolvase RuvX [Marinihelvus fidelis]